MQPVATEPGRLDTNGAAKPASADEAIAELRTGPLDVFHVYRAALKVMTPTDLSRVTGQSRHVCLGIGAESPGNPANMTVAALRTPAVLRALGLEAEATEWERRVRP